MHLARAKFRQGLPRNSVILPSGNFVNGFVLLGEMWRIFHRNFVGHGEISQPFHRNIVNIIIIIIIIIIKLEGDMYPESFFPVWITFAGQNRDS